MGRNAGWLTGAAALAKAEDCEGVDMICLPEVAFDIDHFIERLDVLQRAKAGVVIAVSEGVRVHDGRYVCELTEELGPVDAFGHKTLTGAARFLANKAVRELGCKARAIELSTLQRCSSHMASRVDITEAFQVGGAAAQGCFRGGTAARWWACAAFPTTRTSAPPSCTISIPSRILKKRFRASGSHRTA